MKVSKIISANSKTKQPIKSHGIFYSSSEAASRRQLQGCSHAAQEEDHTIVGIRKSAPALCGMGALCGAAVGFLMYLHLGPFKNPEDAGYATGLFVKSGVQLGFIV
jgi:hypothetical protein